MADEFRTIQKLPPLRLTVAEVAQLGTELTAKVKSGGRVDISYSVKLADDSRFSRDSTEAFLQNVDAEGERISSVEVSAQGWQEPEGPAKGPLAKHIQLRLHDFGSDFYVSSGDVLWGKGAVEDIKKRLQRHRPWFAPLLGALPVVVGGLWPLPLIFIGIAVQHERGVTAPLVAVVILSLLLLVADVWFWREHSRQRLFAHTVISRTQSRRTWSPAKFVLAAVAFVADIATTIGLLIVLLNE